MDTSDGDRCDLWELESLAVAAEGDKISFRRHGFLFLSPSETVT